MQPGNGRGTSESGTTAWLQASLQTGQGVARQRAACPLICLVPASGHWSYLLFLCYLCGLVLGFLPEGRLPSLAAICLDLCQQGSPTSDRWSRQMFCTRPGSSSCTRLVECRQGPRRRMEPLILGVGQDFRGLLPLRARCPLCSFRTVRIRIDPGVQNRELDK